MAVLMPPLRLDWHEHAGRQGSMLRTQLDGGSDMALQVGDLRDTLIDAGARPEKADEAAEEVAATSFSVNCTKTRIG